MKLSFGVDPLGQNVEIDGSNSYYVYGKDASVLLEKILQNFPTSQKEGRFVISSQGDEASFNSALNEIHEIGLENTLLIRSLVLDGKSMKEAVNEIPWTIAFIVVNSFVDFFAKYETEVQQILYMRRFLKLNLFIVDKRSNPYTSERRTLARFLDFKYRIIEGGTPEWITESILYINEPMWEALPRSIETLEDSRYVLIDYSGAKFKMELFKPYI